MPIYRIEFVDHGGNVWATDLIEHDDDAGAIEKARRLHIPRIGYGFDLWDGARLVHSHRDREPR